MEEIGRFYGNHTARQFLKKISEENRVGHAYLIYGEDGLGKKAFAERFAQTILCKGFPKPCFCCLPCRKISQKTHPDVTWLLGGEGNSSLGRNSLHIEEIRRLRADCQVKPNESEKKVYIITNVQNMTEGAFNAFLKTLEEPPSHAVFLLTAPNIDRLAPTIVSRTVPIQLFPLSGEEMKEALSERFPDLPEGLRETAAAAAAGNLGQAQKILADEDFVKMQKTAEEFCALVSQGKEYELLRLLYPMEKEKNSLDLLLEEAQLIFRGVLLARFGRRGMGKSYSFAGQMTQKQLQETILFLQQIRMKLKTNANPSLLCAYLCAGLMQRYDR